MKNYKQILFFMCLFFAISFANLQRDLDVQLIKTEPQIVSSNSAFDVELLITNNGLEDKRVSIVLLYNSFFGSFVASDKSYLPIDEIGSIIKANESKSYSFRAVSRDLVLNKNPMQLFIENVDNRKENFVKTILIDADISKTNLDISFNEYFQSQEDYVTFNLILIPNKEIYNVNIMFDFSKIPMMIKGNDNNLFLKEINNKSIIPLKMYFHNALSSGIYQIPLFITFEDQNQNEFTSNKFLPIKLDFKDQLVVGRVTSNPTRLIRDSKMNEIKIELVNSGKDQIKDLRATLIFESNEFTPSFFGSERVNLGLLDSNKIKEATFFFDLSKQVTGMQKAYLQLDYIFNFEKVNKVIPLDLFVTKAPYFEISKEVIERDGDLVKFYVKNIGESCNDFEVVGLTQNLPISWVQNSDKAAKLDKEDEKEFVLEMKFTDLAVDKVYGIPIRLRCVYNSQPITQDEEVLVRSFGKDVNYLPFIAIGFLFLIILILVGKYFFLNQEKKKKK